MTDLLQRAFEEASKLTADQQNRLAEWLLEELADEERWMRRFAETASVLERLASEARDEHGDGATKDLDTNFP